MLNLNQINLRQGINNIKKQLKSQIKQLSKKHETNVKLVVANEYKNDEEGEPWLYVVNNKGVVLEKKKVAEVLKEIKSQLLEKLQKNQMMLDFLNIPEIRNLKNDIDSFDPSDKANKLFIYLKLEEIKHQVKAVKFIMSLKEPKKTQVPGMKTLHKNTLHYSVVKYNPAPEMVKNDTIDSLLNVIFAKLVASRAQFAGEEKKGLDSLPETH